MKIKNTLNAKEFQKTGEVNNFPSMTIPDQTMTIKEILDRFTRGLPLDAGKVPIYEGEEFTPDLRYMDLAEREEFIENTFAKARQIQESHKTVSNTEEVLETETSTNLT